MSEPSDKRYRIGQVCKLLRDEFPDITISKLRFLQDKGIVNPERTPGGYRMYSEADVAALRAALHMQRDQFMPLKVIREELRRRLDGGAAAVPAAPRAVGTLPPVGEVRFDEDVELVSVEAVVRAANVTHDFVDACRAAEIVSGQVGDGGVMMFTQDEVGLVTFAGKLSRQGIDVRHLRGVAKAMARQGSLVERSTVAMLRSANDAQRERALSAVEELTAELAEFMRIAFVRDVKLMTARTLPRVRSNA